MDRVTKALRRMPMKRRAALLRLINRVEAGSVAGLDIVKLRGYKFLFRVRKGELRLIAKRVDDGYRAVILEGRSETTYKELEKFDKPVR